MHRFNALLSMLCLLANLSLAQTSIPRPQAKMPNQAGVASGTSFVFKINYHVRKYEDVSDLDKVLRALDGFLRTKNESDTSNAYWLPSDFARYRQPFHDLFWIELSVTFRNRNFYKPTLLDVVQTPVEGEYIVKLAYAGPDSLPVGTLHAIYNIVAVKQPDGEYKFKNMLGMNTAQWHTTQVGSITYLYPDALNRDLAEKMNQFNLNLAAKLHTAPIPITYYKCKDPVELFRIKGFDYNTYMYLSPTGGRAEDNNTIFAANNSEWYPHEVVHFYTGAALGDRVSGEIFEGYATYLGGAGGKSFEENVKSVRRFYKEHPERNILEDVERDYRLGGEVQVKYAIGALICKLVDEKYGLDGIKRLFNQPDFYAAVESVLGVRKAELPGFLRMELAKYQ